MCARDSHGGWKDALRSLRAIERHENALRDSRIPACGPRDEHRATRSRQHLKRSAAEIPSRETTLALTPEDSEIRIELERHRPNALGGMTLLESKLDRPPEELGGFLHEPLEVCARFLTRDLPLDHVRGFPSGTTAEWLHDVEERDLTAETLRDSYGVTNARF